MTKIRIFWDKFMVNIYLNINKFGIMKVNFWGDVIFMAKYTWITKLVPKELLVKQVYGVVFSNDGNILLRLDDGKYKLTGGKPENSDKDFCDTLIREYMEELNIELEDIYYLGYLFVEEKKEKYAQVRMIAKIKSIGSIKPDIDNGRVYGRFMSKQVNVKKYLNYQDLAGNQLLDDAIKRLMKNITLYLKIKNIIFNNESGEKLW